MTWTAPEVPRTDPASVGDERTVLEQYLEFHRATLMRKCAGLDGEQLCRRASPPARLSLLGLVRHLTDVERIWFQTRLGGDAEVGQLYWTDEHPDGDFDLVDPAGAEADFAVYLAAVDASRAAAVGLPLDGTFVHPREGDWSLRALYVHMIEEYARHNGHADLLREAIDGATGE
jgi:hypothetical protein